MSNYTNFAIKGKTVGIRFGLPAVRRIGEAADKYPLSDSNGYYNAGGVAVIIYSGYLNACIVKELTPELSLEDFYNEIEESYFTQDEDSRYMDAIAIVGLYSQSLVVKSLLAEQKKREALTAEMMKNTTNPSPEVSSTGTPLNNSASESSG
jgi:hypothetical protein